ncbi:MAG: hypothetical protein D3922_10165, partial [Candidatus Electrothrix sp. AR1]|nr:hypothetical protein [Candidatus Electrothrix sp. AR1]
MPDNKGNLFLYMFFPVKTGVLLLILLLCSTWMSISHAQDSSNDHPQVEEVIKLVEEHFYDADAVSGTRWKEAAQQLRDDIDSTTGPDQLADKINALLATLNTSHTRYFSKGDPKRYQLLGLFHAL